MGITAHLRGGPHDGETHDVMVGNRLLIPNGDDRRLIGWDGERFIYDYPTHVYKLDRVKPDGNPSEFLFRYTGYEFSEGDLLGGAQSG